MALTLDKIRWRPWQAKALAAILSGDHRGVAIAGGKGSGKSLVVCASAVLLCLTRPGIRVTLAMDCYRSLKDIHVPFVTQLIANLEAEYKYASYEAHFKNGAVLVLRHLDFAGDPTLGGSPLEGPNMGAILIDESQKIDPRYFLNALERTRTTDNDMPPVVVFGGLPVNTWWCRFAMERGWPVFRPKTSENAENLTPTYEADLRAAYTEAQARALLDGEELIMEGAVLKEYRQAPYPQGNLTPDGWKPNYAQNRTMLSVDLGIRSPHALLWVEDVELGAWVVVKEWAPDHVSISELCQMILKDAVPRKGLIAPNKAPIDKIVIDPAGIARTAQTGHADADVWAMNPPIGFGLRPSWERDPTRRGVVEGLTRMAISLESRKLLFAQDLIASGMRVDAKKRSLAKALVNYKWDDKNQSRPLKDGFNDHAIDALNYGHREVLWDGKPKQPIRLDVGSDPYGVGDPYGGLARDLR